MRVVVVVMMMMMMMNRLPLSSLLDKSTFVSLQDLVPINRVPICCTTLPFKHTVLLSELSRSMWRFFSVKRFKSADKGYE